MSLRGSSSQEPFLSLQTNIVAAQQLIKQEGHNGKQLIQAIKSIFSSLTSDAYHQLDDKEKDFVDLLSHVVPANFFPEIMDKVSSVFHKSISSDTSSQMEVHQEEESCAIFYEDVASWEFGTEDEKEAFHLLREVCPGKKIDLSHLHLTSLPTCFFTEERFSHIQLNLEAVEKLPELKIADVKCNQGVYTAISKRTSKENVLSFSDEQNLANAVIEDYENTEEMTLIPEQAEKMRGALKGRWDFQKFNGQEGPFTINLDEIVESANLKGFRNKAVVLLREIIFSVAEAPLYRFQNNRYSPSFLKHPLSVKEICILFCLLDYLSLNKFKKEYLEPFNRVFPHIPLSDIPPELKNNINRLDFLDLDIKDVDLSDFHGLIHVGFRRAKNFSAYTLNSLPNKMKANIKELNLEDCDLEGLDLSGFTSLNSIVFKGSKNFSVDLIHSLPLEIKAQIFKLEFSQAEEGDNILRPDVEGLDLSDFLSLSDIGFDGAINFSVDMINSLPIEIKQNIINIYLRGCEAEDVNVENLSFLDCKALNSIIIRKGTGVVSSMINDLPASIKKQMVCLDLSFCRADEIDLSEFENLCTLYLSEATNLSSSLNTLSSKGKRELDNFSFNWCDLKRVNFSDFEQVGEFSFSTAWNFSAALNTLPLHVKQESFEFLEISRCDLSEEDFSHEGFKDFTALNSIDLSESQNFSEALETFPSEVKDQIEKINCSKCNLMDESIPGFTNLTSLELKEARNFTNFLETLSDNAQDSIEEVDFEGCDLKDEHFSSLRGVQTIILSKAINFSSALRSVSSESKNTITEIDFSKCDLEDVDLSDYLALSVLRMKEAKHVLSLLNSLSSEAKANITVLDLSGCDLTDVDLSGFTNLKKIQLSKAKNIVFALDTLPVSAKRNLKDLDLSDCALAGVDLSACTSLKEINFSRSENIFFALDSLSLETKAEMQEMVLIDCDLTDVSFSSFTSLTKLNLQGAKNASKALDTLPEFFLKKKRGVKRKVAEEIEDSKIKRLS